MVSTRRGALALALAAAVVLSACGGGGTDTPPAPALQLGSSALDFTWTVGAAAPAGQSLPITNSGGGTLATPTATVSYLDGSGWLVATVLGAAAPFTLDVVPSPALLAPGTYRASVSVASAGATGSPRTVAVTLTVTAPATLVSTPTALTFTAVAGGAAPPPRVVSAFNTGAGTLDQPAVTVNYTTGAGWLTATLSGTDEPYTVTVRALPAGLAAGRYDAVLRLDSHPGTGGVQDVPVTLTVNDPVADRLVTVTSRANLWSESGLPSTASAGALDTLTLRQVAPGGAVTDVPAASDGDGHWTASLPPGPYWVMTTSRFTSPRHYEIASGANEVDLGFDITDAGAERLSSQPTTVTFDLAGLLPWVAATDQIQVYDATADAWYASRFGDPITMVDGSTSGTFTFDWTPINLFLARPGDTIWATQLRAVPTGATPYSRVVAAQAIPGVAMADGVPVTLEARGLQPTSATASLTVDLRAGAFAAAMPEAGTGTFLDVYVMAQTYPLVVSTNAIDLLELLTDGATDHDYGALTYFRFLPRSYREMLVVNRVTRLTRTHPGGKSRRLSAIAQRIDPLAAAPSVVAPAVGAVPAVRVGGADVTAAPATGVGLEPVLAWDAPAVGTADTYHLELFELFDDPAFTSAQTRRVGAAWTTSRTFTVPAGWLEAGKTYLASLEATRDAGLAAGVTPLRLSPQRAFTSGWTQTFSP